MKDTSYVYRIASTVITDSRAFFSGNVEPEERVVPSPKVWKLLLVTHSGILSEIPAVSESLREKKANPNSDPSASACKSALLDLSENEVSPADVHPLGTCRGPRCAIGFQFLERRSARQSGLQEPPLCRREVTIATMVDFSPARMGWHLPQSSNGFLYFRTWRWKF